MTFLLATLTLCLTVSAADVLQIAREHARKGELDDLVFDFQGVVLVEADARVAAEILAEAGKAALLKHDLVMALQFGQMSLRYAAAQPVALEVAATAALGLQQYSGAAEYADRWIGSSPRATQPKLLRAQIALDEAEWEHVTAILKGVTEDGLTIDEVAHLRKLRTTAEHELSEKGQQLTVLKSLELQLRTAAHSAKSKPAAVSSAGPEKATSRHVVVYGTSWCGVCMRTRGWLQKHHIPFEDKDVEKDFAARDELVEKAQAQGVSLGGVPVIDVNGKLMLGFDEAKLRELLL